MTIRRERGFVAIEWVAAIAMLLLPGGRARRARCRRGPSAGTRRRSRPGRPRAICNGTGRTATPRKPSSSRKYVAADHGIDPSDVSVRVLAVGANPGDQIRVEVRRRDAGDRGARPAAGRRVDLHGGRVAARRRLPEPMMVACDARDEHGMITLWILGLTVCGDVPRRAQPRPLARDRGPARGVGDGRRRRDRRRERSRRRRAAGRSAPARREPCPAARRGRARGVSERRAPQRRRGDGRRARR